jgi:hypothetical protein
MSYQPRTDADLKQIAEDLYSGKIFCDWHLRNKEDCRFVFMPIGIGGEGIFQTLIDAKAEFLFEYLDKAGPRSVNGYPSFFSLQYLNGEDTAKMFGYYEKIKAALAAL